MAGDFSVFASLNNFGNTSFATQIKSMYLIQPLSAAGNLARFLSLCPQYYLEENISPLRKLLERCVTLWHFKHCTVHWFRVQMPCKYQAHKLVSMTWRDKSLVMELRHSTVRFTQWLTIYLFAWQKCANFNYKALFKVIRRRCFSAYQIVIWYCNSQAMKIFVNPHYALGR